MSGAPIDKAKALLKFGARAMNEARFEDVERAYREAATVSNRLRRC